MTQSCQNCRSIFCKKKKINKNLILTQLHLKYLLLHTKMCDFFNKKKGNISLGGAMFILNQRKVFSCRKKRFDFTVVCLIESPVSA